MVMSTSKVKFEQTLSIVVTKADGTVIDHGDVAFKSSNPFKTFWWYLRHPKQWRHKMIDKPLAKLKRRFNPPTPT